MESRSFYNEILTEHNMHPDFKHDLSDADIVLGKIIGQKTEDALHDAKLFMRMIRGEATEEEIDSLEEASALRDIAHMPARVKCAMLGWRTLAEALGEKME